MVGRIRLSSASNDFMSWWVHKVGQSSTCRDQWCVHVLHTSGWIDVFKPLVPLIGFHSKSGREPINIPVHSPIHPSTHPSTRPSIPLSISPFVSLPVSGFWSPHCYFTPNNHGATGDFRVGGHPFVHSSVNPSTQSPVGLSAHSFIHCWAHKQAEMLNNHVGGEQLTWFDIRQQNDIEH